MKAFERVLALFKNKSRNTVLDLLKLYGMLSVVLDHSMQHILGDQIKSTQLYNWVFISQMPVFMFVSGFLLYPKIKQKLSRNDYCIRIVTISANLLIPFFVYSIILCVLSCDFSLIIESVLFPENSLWFLWVMFWMQVLMITSQQFVRKFFVDDFICFFVSIVFYLFLLLPSFCLLCVNNSLFSVKLIVYYSFFLLFGYAFSYVETNYKLLKTDKEMVFCMIACLIIITCAMIKHPSFIFDAESIINIVIRVVASICAVLFLYCLSCFLVKCRTVRGVSILGSFSLEMYFIHLLLIRIPFFKSKTDCISFFILEYILIVVFSFLLIFLIKNSVVLDCVFFGKIPQEKVSLICKKTD